MTTKTYHFMRPLALLVCTALAASVMMVVLASPAQAAGSTVNSLADDADPDDGNCTLREAITSANTDTASGAASGECVPGSLIIDGVTEVGGQGIEVGVEGTVNLTGPLPDISSRIHIVGPGADKFTVRRDTGGDYGIFHVPECFCERSLIISGMTISNGKGGFGGGIRNGFGVSVSIHHSTISDNTAGSGGGIYNAGNMFILHSTIRSNTAGNTGGGIYNAEAGDMFLNQSTVSGNTANTFGGGVFSDTVFSLRDGGPRGAFPERSHIRNSTISGNTAGTAGGGVFNLHGLTRLESSTITKNTAPSNSGSGVASWGETRLEPIEETRTEVSSTIISANEGTVSANEGTDADFYIPDAEVPPEAFVNSFISEGYNLVGDGSAIANNAPNTDNHAFDQAGDQTNVTHPKLGALADTGGPTPTHALLSDSPALDAGPPDLCLGIDQRGVTRPQDGNNDGTARCDIGSFEVVTNNRECQPSGSDVVCTFTYKGIPGSIGTARGQAQYWAVPDGVSQATFAVSGAKGGSDGISGIPAGGKGGKASATIAVTPGHTLQVNVGGRGGDAAVNDNMGGGDGGDGGFNGGADGGGGLIGKGNGGGGGGASDVRSGAFELDDRIIVGGGGGGAGDTGDTGLVSGGEGGAGGGLSGGDGLAITDGGGGGSGGTNSTGGLGGVAGDVSGTLCIGTIPCTSNGGDGVSGTGGTGGHDFGGATGTTGSGGGGGGGGYYGGGGGGGAGTFAGGLAGGGGGGGSGFGPSGVVFDSGVQSGNGLVTITYTDPAANDAPVNTVPGAQSTDEDTALTFNSANTNLISISDVDAGTSSPVKVTLGVSHGKLTLGDTSGLTFAAGSTNATANMTFTGTIASINTALSGLTYDPDANYNGSDTLSITTDDQGNTGSDGAKSDTDTVSLTVNSVNDAPVANDDDTASGAEDGNPIQINLGTLVNDVETQDASLTYTIVSGPTAQQGTLTADPNTAGVYSFDSAQDFNGFFDIFYTVTDRGDPDNCQAASPEPAQGCDATETSLQKKVTVTVNALNDPPTANAQSVTTNENINKVITLTGDDVDGDILSYKITSLPTNGKLYEGNSTAAAAEITSVPFSLPSGVNQVTYVPNLNYNNTAETADSFDFKVNDGTVDSAAAAKVSITVTPDNDAPTVEVAAGGSCGPNGRSGTINLTVDDPDGPEGSLTLSATSSNTALVPTSKVTFGGTEAARTLTATARSGRTGTALLTVTVSDDAQGSGTVTVNVQVGSNGVDNLSGTPGSDMIFARGAKDTASGQAANDLLCGGDGNDTLTGDAGDDTLSGDAGRDTMTGGAGADFFSGGSGTDTATDFTDGVDTKSSIP